MGYPVEYIPNAELSGMSPSVPKTEIFLTAAAYGELPPISKLDRNQAMYYFVSGFTSKVAGTEIGVTEPVPTFSTCFGEPFLPLDPSVYAAMLAEKVEKAGAGAPFSKEKMCPCIAAYRYNTWEEAVAIAEESDFLHKVLPEELSRRYFAEERARCEALRAAADPAEYERIHYFNAI